MKNINISTKADTLKSLKDIVKCSYVEDLYILYVEDFVINKSKILEMLKELFNGDRIVVRSSSCDEDGVLESNAGHYESVLDVDSSSLNDINNAVDLVINSYLKDGKTLDAIMNEQVLVQRMTKNVLFAGVVFTRDLMHNRPYYMINYDDTGSTDSVTSGKAGKIIWVAKNALVEMVLNPFDNLVKAVKEIESIFGLDKLDIEFAIKKSGKVIIFQVRHLSAILHKKIPVCDKELFEAKSYAKLNYLDINHVMSDMAFWNPSEIIGDNPFPLDYSLYNEIITSKIWSKGLEVLGYQLIDDEIMYKIGNKPYISVDYTFEGLMPDELRPELKIKLKNYYMKKLKEDTTAHDKIEFEVVFSTYDFMTEKNLEVLLDYGFTKNEINEIRNALRNITYKAVLDYESIYDDDTRALWDMKSLRHVIRHNKFGKEKNIIKLTRYINDLINSIKRYGTPQFSRQARLAFMARSFCKTLVERGYINKEDMDSFMLSINTVASDFERDFDAYSHGEITREVFNQRYGHLRLGTYNIRSDCYAKMYFDIGKTKIGASKKKELEGKDLNYMDVTRALEDNELDISPEKFINFIKQSTKNREFFKFEFTKSLSLILEIVIRIGEVLGIEREDLSYLKIYDLVSMHSRAALIHLIDNRKKMHIINSYLVLPELVFDIRDIDTIKVSDARPNFITANIAEGEVVLLDINKDVDLTDKIVVLQKADPGYDWIFAKNIKGFITRYGGAASHMAIRCAEFNIPAAIGCGEKIFTEIKHMKKLLLDCKNGIIKQI